MSKFDITHTIFYRWRYWIGYGSIVVLLGGLLYTAGFLIPSGLSEAELDSVVTTSQLSFTELWHQTPTHAPFHLLQYASLKLFGPTLLGIKLPSIIIGILTAISLVVLLRRWFKPSVAVLASVVAVTTGQFLFLAQQGSPAILYLFWPVTLILLATLVAKRVKLHHTWKFFFFITAALSLYTPLSIYVLIALGSAVLLHPHLRYIVKRLTRVYVIIGIIASLLLLTPLAFSIVKDPGLGLRLLGVPTEWPDLLVNLGALTQQYLGFMSLGSGSILLPIFGLASMLIILFGLYRVIRNAETVEGYIILSWVILLLPVLIINPAFISIMFVPLVLLLASGLSGILRQWYGLFPHNPYARITGLFPLIILIGSMVFFGLERYAYAYRYAPDIVSNFSSDILIIPDTKHLVVADDEVPLYTALTHFGADFTVTTLPPVATEYAVTANAYQADGIPSGVVVSPRAEAGARFYLYK